MDEMCIRDRVRREVTRLQILSIVWHLTVQVSLQKSISVRACVCWFPEGFRQAAM